MDLVQCDFCQISFNKCPNRHRLAHSNWTVISQYNMYAAIRFNLYDRKLFIFSLLNATDVLSEIVPYNLKKSVIKPFLLYIMYMSLHTVLQLIM